MLLCASPAARIVIAGVDCFRYVHANGGIEYSVCGIWPSRYECLCWLRRPGGLPGLSSGGVSTLVCIGARLGGEIVAAR